MQNCVLNYNGERQDLINGAYHLGNDYRAYHPQLKRFSCPDSWSPFGAGGINPYAYCVGDPINHADPSGHFSWQAGLGIGLGIVGLLGAIFSGGTSLVATGSLDAALGSANLLSLISGSAGVVADISGIASTALGGIHASAASALGWVSFACGMISGVLTLGSALLAGRQLAHPEIILWRDEENIRPVYTSTVPHVGDPSGRMKDVEFVFDDNYKNGRRLNIVAHGGYDPDVGYAGVSNGITAFTGDRFARHLTDNGFADFKDYQFARLIVCNSATGEENSFAATFARQSGLPTKGYMGSVGTDARLRRFVNFGDAENNPSLPRTTPLRARLTTAELNENLQLFKLALPELFRVIKNIPDHPYRPFYFDLMGKTVAGFNRIE